LATSAERLHRLPLQPGRIRVEHVTMETADEGVAPPEETTRAALRTCVIEGPFRQPGGELTILDGHYLGVRSVHPGKGPCEYQLDLRFARPGQVRVHRIPWGWLGVATFLAALGAAALAFAASRGLDGAAIFLIVGLAALAASPLAGYAAARSAMTLVEIRSVHGDAPIARVCGQVGRARIDGAFADELAGHIEAARRARPQDRKQFLCDLMREHHRLRSLGILGEEEYEAGKARILAAH
jgi:hypothetical protein